MKEVLLRIKVDDKELDALESELKQVGASFDVVDKNAKKASSSIDDVASNGGAIAILDQLTGGLATRLRDAFEATKLFNVSLKGTRTALIATGIGAFVVALGAVVAYWDDIVELITQANKRLDEQINATKSVLENLNAQVAVLDKQIELAELQGEAGEELQKQKIALLERLKEQQEEEIRLLEIQLQRLKATETEVGFWDSLVANIKFSLFGAKGVADEATALAAERLQQIKELETAIESAKAKALDLSIQMFKLQNPETDFGGATPQVELVNGLTPQGIAEFDAFKALNDMKIEDEKRYLNELTNLRDNELEANLARERFVNAQKLALTQDTLGKMTQILGENTAAGKAAAAALALINTYQGVTQIWSNKTTLPEPFGTINKVASTVLALKSGLDAVKAIKSTKIPVFKGSGGGGGGGGTAPIPAPSFNIVGDTGINGVADAINNQTQQPPRAYIVYDDIKQANELDNNTLQGATI